MGLGETLGPERTQVDFLSGVIRLQAGETTNDEAREVPIVPQLRTLLEKRHAQRQDGCKYACFRLDRTGHSVKINSFRKAWYSACVKTGLGKMVRAVSSVTGEPLYERPRGPRSKPKAKMTFEGTIFHDLRRTGARNLVHAGVPEKVAMAIGGWKTRSILDRYTIVSPKDVVEAGRAGSFSQSGRPESRGHFGDSERI
jgi:integrase